MRFGLLPIFSRFLRFAPHRRIESPVVAYFRQSVHRIGENGGTPPISCAASGVPSPPPDGVGIEKTMFVLSGFGRVIRVLPPLVVVPSPMNVPPRIAPVDLQIKLAPENVPLKIAPLFTKFAPVHAPPPIFELYEFMFGIEQVPVADVANTPPDKGLFDARLIPAPLVASNRLEALVVLSLTDQGTSVG